MIGYAVAFLIGCAVGAIGMLFQMKEVIQESPIITQIRVGGEDIEELLGEDKQRANRHDSGANAPELELQDELEMPKEV